jgi:hypothetical protein
MWVPIMRTLEPLVGAIHELPLPRVLASIQQYLFRFWCRRVGFV